jgi:hypothetical protein
MIGEAVMSAASAGATTKELVDHFRAVADFLEAYDAYNNQGTTQEYKTRPVFRTPLKAPPPPQSPGATCALGASGSTPTDKQLASEALYADIWLAGYDVSTIGADAIIDWRQNQDQSADVLTTFGPFHLLPPTEKAIHPSRTVTQAMKQLDQLDEDQKRFPEDDDKFDLDANTRARIIDQSAKAAIRVRGSIETFKKLVAKYAQFPEDDEEEVTSPAIASKPVLSRQKEVSPLSPRAPEAAVLTDKFKGANLAPN